MRVRVENREVARIGDVPDLPCVRDHHVREANSKRKRRERTVVGMDREERCEPGDEQERELLEQAPETVSDAPPRERPDVEQQERGWKDDDCRLGQQAEDECDDHERMPAKGERLGVRDVQEEGGDREEGAERVFSLGDPGDGVCTQGVQGKEERHDEAPPPGMREAIQRQEQQDRAATVKDEVEEMMAAGVEAPEVDVQHVGEPREWVPQGRVGCHEGPVRCGEAEAVPDVVILRHVLRIVE